MSLPVAAGFAVREQHLFVRARVRALSLLFVRVCVRACVVFCMRLFARVRLRGWRFEWLGLSVFFMHLFASVR